MMVDVRNAITIPTIALGVSIHLIIASHAKNSILLMVGYASSARIYYRVVIIVLINIVVKLV